MYLLRDRAARYKVSRLGERERVDRSAGDAKGDVPEGPVGMLSLRPEGRIHHDGVDRGLGLIHRSDDKSDAAPQPASSDSRDSHGARIDLNPFDAARPQKARANREDSSAAPKVKEMAVYQIAASHRFFQELRGALERRHDLLPIRPRRREGRYGGQGPNEIATPHRRGSPVLIS